MNDSLSAAGLEADSLPQGLRCGPLPVWRQTPYCKYKVSEVVRVRCSRVKEQEKIIIVLTRLR